MNENAPVLSAAGVQPGGVRHGTRARRGYSVYAFIIVLTIFLIAAISIQVVRQKSGDLPWNASGFAAESTVPRCLLPGSTARVKGELNVYSNVSGFTCATIPIPSGLTAAEVAGVVAANRAQIDAACGADTGLRRYSGTGTYSCAGGAEGYASSSKHVSPAGVLMTFAGASYRLADILKQNANCGPGRVPSLVSGTVKMYADAKTRDPCASLTITTPVAANLANLEKIENDLARSCGRRAGWFVVDAKCVCPRREGFFCWGGDNARENFSAGCAGCGAGFRNNGSCGQQRREGFHPDRPGACSGKTYGWAQNARAAQYELEAIKVLDGSV